MLFHRNSFLFSVLLLLAVGALALSSLALQGEEEKQDQRGQTAARAWRLIGDYEQDGNNVVVLAEQVLALSPEQGRQMLGLRVEQEQEKARLLEELGRTYTDKVRSALEDGQKQRYDAALNALEELTRAVTEARDEFLTTAGADAARRALVSDRYVSTTDLTRFLDVSAEKRRQLDQIRQETARVLVNALQDRLDPASRSDPAAWQEHRRQYRAAEKRAQEDMRQRREAILTPEQLERLEEIEAAAVSYRRGLQDARRQAYGELHKLLQGSEAD